MQKNFYNFEVLRNVDEGAEWVMDRGSEIEELYFNNQVNEIPNNVRRMIEELFESIGYPANKSFAGKVEYFKSMHLNYFDLTNEQFNKLIDFGNYGSHNDINLSKHELIDYIELAYNFFRIWLKGRNYNDYMAIKPELLQFNRLIYEAGEQQVNNAQVDIVLLAEAMHNHTKKLNEADAYKMRRIADEIAIVKNMFHDLNAKKLDNSGQTKTFEFTEFNIVKKFSLNTGASFKWDNATNTIKMLRHPFLFKPTSDGDFFKTKKVSGTNFLAAAGADKFSQPSLHWLQRIHVFKEDINPKYMEIANTIEPKQLAFLADMMNIRVYSNNNDLWSDYENENFSGLKDGWTDYEIVECKTTSWKKFSGRYGWGYDINTRSLTTIPESYQYQAGLYMYLENEEKNVQKNTKFVVSFLENYEYYLGKWIVGEEIFQSFVDVCDRYESELYDEESKNVAITKFENSRIYGVVLNGKAQITRGLFLGRESYYIGKYGENFEPNTKNTHTIVLKYDDIIDEVKLKVEAALKFNETYLKKDHMVSPRFDLNNYKEKAILTKMKEFDMFDQSKE